MPPDFVLDKIRNETYSTTVVAENGNTNEDEKDMNDNQQPFQQQQQEGKGTEEEQHVVESNNSTKGGTSKKKKTKGETKENDNVVWPHSKIKFNLKNTSTHYIRARADMSIEEFIGVWYQIHEYSTISSTNRLTVKLMRQQGHLDNEPDKCIRGLEHRLKGQNKKRKEIKLNAIDAVLHEQASQRKFGTADPHTISDVYRLHTVTVAVEAYRRAIQDEETIKLQEEKDGEKNDASKLLPETPRRRSSLFLDEEDLQELQELDLEEEEDRFQQRVLDGTKMKKKGGVYGSLRAVGTFLKKRGLTPPRRTRSEVPSKPGSVVRTLTPPRRVKSELPKASDIQLSPVPSAPSSSTATKSTRSRTRASSPKPTSKGLTMKSPNGSAPRSLSPLFTLRKANPAMKIPRTVDSKVSTRPARKRTERRPSL